MTVTKPRRTTKGIGARMASSRQNRSGSVHVGRSRLGLEVYTRRVGETVRKSNNAPGAAGSRSRRPRGVFAVSNPGPAVFPRLRVLGELVRRLVQEPLQFLQAFPVRLPGEVSGRRFGLAGGDLPLQVLFLFRQLGPETGVSGRLLDLALGQPNLHQEQ